MSPTAVGKGSAAATLSIEKPAPLAMRVREFPHERYWTWSSTGMTAWREKTKKTLGALVVTRYERK